MNAETDFTKELEVASQLAREAGALIMGLYDTDVAVELKGKNDPVTVADQRANDLLVAALRRHFPADGVVAEESPDRSDAQSKRRCWFVDPLDGTKEFIAKNGEFSVMIGLAIDGAAKVGVVYKPVGDKLYRGAVGHKAEAVVGGEVSAIQVSPTDQTAQLRLVVSRSHRAKSTDELVGALGIQQEKRSGSVGLKVGLIAERQADLYVHLSGKSSRWDACGPEAVLRAAGGKFTDLFGDPFDYRSTEILNSRGILACNAASYAAVQPTVTRLAEAALGGER